MAENTTPREQSVQRFFVRNHATYRYFDVVERKDDSAEELVCITVYRKGAEEVARRLNRLTALACQ